MDAPKERIPEEMVYKFWPWPGVSLINRPARDFGHAAVYPIVDSPPAPRTIR